MSNRFRVHVHIPRNSADPMYRIIDGDTDNWDVVAIVDPDAAYTDPEQVAHEIAAAMNTQRVLGG